MQFCNLVCDSCQGDGVFDRDEWNSSSELHFTSEDACDDCLGSGRARCEVCEGELTSVDELADLEDARVHAACLDAY